MLISTKGRYALRIMVDLAERDSKELVPLYSMAVCQDISEKYLESIIVVLSKTGLIEGVRGKKGGYRLNRKPEEYSVGEILRVVEGPLAPVACLETEKNNCERAAACRTLPMWEKLNDLINGYLDQVSLLDLMKTDIVQK